MTQRGTAASTVRALLLSSRPVSWVNTAYPFAAAYLLGSGVGTEDPDRFHLAVLLVGVVYFLVPYNLAMYGINDVFDYESDLRNPRKGGVEGALLDRSVHRATLWAVVVTNVPFLVALVLFGGASSWSVLAVSIFAVIAYSAPRLRFKERPFLDSLTSSTHFVSPAVYGLALAGPRWTGALVAVCVAFFLWGIASHAFGAVQDVEADRAGGIGSVATVIGARATVRLAFVAYVVAGLVMLGTAFPGPIAAVIVVPYALNVLPWWRVDDGHAAAANAGWRRFLWINYLAGFLVTMALFGYALTR